MKDKLTIKQLRVLHDLTQESMAEILGIHTQTYRKKETGVSKWTLDDVVAIKKHFKINIDDLKETQV